VLLHENIILGGGYDRNYPSGDYGKGYGQIIGFLLPCSWHQKGF
jgi:hypothetical protein